MNRKKNKATQNTTNNFFTNNFLSGNKVLFLVPHQDDEINVGGDLLCTLIENNCDVHIVYSTNGDYFSDVPGETRLTEAIKVAKYFGIKKDNVHFLGYGDRLYLNNIHIYNALDDTEYTSNSGHTHTYGLDTNEDYHFIKTGLHAAYTKKNLYNDLYDIINDLKADAIFAIDYDTHPDHIALSLMFEKIISELIKKELYRPLIFKSFGYDTSFYCTRDYSNLNISHTLKPCNSDDNYVFPCYPFESRLRLPVRKETMTDNIFNSYMYKALCLHHSQLDARHFAGRIINSDNVFWERRTDSILYDSQVVVSSGDATPLTDFLIVNSNNITLFEQQLNRSLLNSCSWIPDINDINKSCSFHFSEPREISKIVIYENPTPDSSVNLVKISMDNGYEITTKLDIHNGAANIITIEPQHSILELSISIVDYSGTLAGFSEIEAYSNSCSDISSLNKPIFIKLIKDDNFIYRYRTTDTTNLELGIYSYPPSLIKLDDIVIECDNTNILINKKGSSFVLNGKYKHCTIKAYVKDLPDIYDVVTIDKISLINKAYILLKKKSEALLWLRYKILRKLLRKN